MGDKRYWLAATVVVVVLLWLLSLDRDGARAPTGGGPAVPARIVELPKADAPAVATVELAPRARAESATALATRFTAEQADPDVAADAAAGIRRALAPVLDADRVRLTLECRQTVCRARLEAAVAAERPGVIASATTALHDAGHQTLLAHADGRSATLFIGVRTPRTP